MDELPAGKPVEPPVPENSGGQAGGHFNLESGEQTPPPTPAAPAPAAPAPPAPSTGAPASDPVQPEQPAYALDPKAVPGPMPVAGADQKKNTKLLIGVLVTLVLVAGAAAAYYFFFRGDTTADVPTAESSPSVVEEVVEESSEESAFEEFEPVTENSSDLFAEEDETVTPSAEQDAATTDEAGNPIVTSPNELPPSTLDAGAELETKQKVRRKQVEN
ncbi:hypothetical protein COV82_02305 [Candidatus Peregrinibacteria bacterium CG11_big_fil_rev_8_21_14_0_20_46_8]|nr:MAG: hypothetical protein COV82_02305 [Candidatus Peregrinibacteria bacterium CG11_big_fil_rev_8_21_14_0_20_46_8]